MSPPSDLSYKRTVLFGTEKFEIVACEWNQKSVSALHNHGWSECMVLVQSGRFENRAEFGLKTEVQTFEAGEVISTPVGVEHEIRCLSEVGKTLHVYVPKIHAHTEGTDRFSSGTLAKVRENIALGLSNEPTAWRDVDLVLQKISQNAISTSSPYFMNQLFSGIFPETLAAEQIINRTRTTLATFEASPTFTAVEIEVVEKLGELIGWNEKDRDGIGVPGGSAANFMAVHCARQRAAPEFRKHGSRGERFKIFTSKESHYSMKKACLATGLGTDSLVEIDTDESGRMLVNALKLAIKVAKGNGEIPLLVCATAGTTVLGAFDPIDKLADVCEQFNVWLHVDGAWGAPALFSKRARPLMTGVERANSLTFDSHKLFGASLTSSFFLTRHRGLLLEANDVAGGDYIFHTNEVMQDRGRLSWQCGRGADALSFWTLWKSHGTSGLGTFVDRLFTLRDECVAWIRDQPRLELIADPSYLNVCVRVRPPSGDDPNWSKKVRERLRDDDLAFVNFSGNKQGSFLRLILANPKLETAHLTKILQMALEVT
jgi:glutamate/tyrosine decarboxylase-like PLP-dependent enzyme/quercetin dioxygenase-like cupin family protein